MNAKRSEHGQVLVLILLGLVGMFGFAAIAIDGGRYFSERRRAQNAVDAAAYAAAYAGINGQDYETIGKASATLNGYSGAEVQVNNPPISGRYSGSTETIDPDEYYQVIIKYKVDQIFSQIVYGGDLWVEVEAVARGTGRTGFGGDAAVVATCANCCPGLKMNGSALVTITGGDVVSNSTKVPEPGDPCYSAVHNTASGCLKVVGGNVITAGALDVHSSTPSDHCDGDHVQVDLPDYQIITETGNPETYYFPHVPGCEGYDDPSEIHSDSSYPDGTRLNPGYYPNGIEVKRNDTTYLNPGLYCLNGPLKVTSGNLFGTDVMFSLMEEGSVNINVSTTDVILSAPRGDQNGDGVDDYIQDPVLPNLHWSEFLIYMPTENTNTIAIEGGGGSIYTGKIYAPGETSPANGTKCKITGGGSNREDEELELNGSIICYTIEITGNKSFNINYDSTSDDGNPGAIEIAE